MPCRRRPVQADTEPGAAEPVSLVRTADSTLQHDVRVRYRDHFAHRRLPESQAETISQYQPFCTGKRQNEPAAKEGERRPDGNQHQSEPAEQQTGLHARQRCIGFQDDSLAACLWIPLGLNHGTGPFRTSSARRRLRFEAPLMQHSVITPSFLWEFTHGIKSAEL
ncbi:protein of unknown function [Methylococcus capsulatus]|uniref:Uncharacterized protein n=1 Tax=Methylococcus capsulatus TaxID=414 RepID=A0AA35XYZ1_METCP|nr:protein of unknown function [Methylococcus capsulatus]